MAVCVLFLILDRVAYFHGIYWYDRLFHPYLVDLKSFNSSKPIPTRKVIFLYSHDYKTIPMYNHYSRKLLMEYCKKHNHQAMEINHHGMNEISPYWLRVKDLIALSKSHSEDTIFIYMDLDTCINPLMFDKSMNEIIHAMDAGKNWNMYIGKDIDFHKIINTGIMIIKNTPWSKRLLDLWWSKYNPNNWKVKGGKWSCQQNGLQCDWARDNYEQGELETIYRNNELDAKSNIAIVAQHLFSNYRRLNNQSIIYHKMACSDSNRTTFFKTLYDDYQRNAKRLPSH